MGVFCLDRAAQQVFGTSNRLWALTGDVLRALGAERLDEAWTRDGHVPSWLARSWGDRLFTDLGEAVLVCRPLPGRLDLSPVGTYRRGSPAPAGLARSGEHLSVYDTPVAAVLLVFAQTCTAGGGFTVTTLRPPAPGSARSEVAVRRLIARSGMLGSSSSSRRAGRMDPDPFPPRRRTS